MLNKCAKCGKKCHNEFCFLHKPKKVKEPSGMVQFFLDIWKERPHKCQNCNKYLGEEPKGYMFDHILEKNKYPDLKLKKENIMILCLECHDKKTRGFITSFIKEKIEETCLRFNK